MKYDKTVTLKDGTSCLIRDARAEDAAEMVRTFLQTHGETEYLLTLPEECSLTAEGEEAFLQEKEESANAVELCAVVDGVIAGSAGLEPIGGRIKDRHRADFGISVEKAYWGRGIGRALTESCIECARQAGYLQIELQAVAENRSAISLYESAGFREYGRNPMGFRLPDGRFQEIVLMRLAL